jgi:hypothetical protein
MYIVKQCFKAIHTIIKTWQLKLNEIKFGKYIQKTKHQEK